MNVLTFINIRHKAHKTKWKITGGIFDMPRPCSICNHAERKDIDVALKAGEKLKELAGWYGVSTAALSRHRGHIEEQELPRTAEQDDNETIDRLDPYDEENDEYNFDGLGTVLICSCGNVNVGVTGYIDEHAAIVYCPHCDKVGYVSGWLALSLIKLDDKMTKEIKQNADPLPWQKKYSYCNQSKL